MPSAFIDFIMKWVCNYVTKHKSGREANPHLSGITMGFEPNRVERIQ